MPHPFPTLNEQRQPHAWAIAPNADALKSLAEGWQAAFETTLLVGRAGKAVALRGSQTQCQRAADTLAVDAILSKVLIAEEAEKECEEGEGTGAMLQSGGTTQQLQQPTWGGRNFRNGKRPRVAVRPTARALSHTHLTHPHATSTAQHNSLTQHTQHSHTTLSHNTPYTIHTTHPHAHTTRTQQHKRTQQNYR